MKNILRHPLTILVALAIIVAVISLFLTSQRLESYTTTLESQVAEQRQLLVDIATLSARNGSDELTDRILTDCPTNQRERFDFLLGSLDQNLDQEALQELDRLFGRCGDFFAERKAYLAVRFERELAVYEELLSLLDELQSVSSQQGELEAWNELVTLELEQGRSFRQLVRSQDTIIQAIINSGGTDTEEVVEASQAAREIQENLLLATTQARAIREELTTE